MIRGKAATPAAVRTAMRDAQVIEFHSHGFVDRGLSDASYLALTPDAVGRYALTAADVAATPLRRAPLVILAACHAAFDAPFLDESVGLPLAFIHAGARAVLASPATVDDAGAAVFFRGVRARITAGASPAVAARDERIARLGGAFDWASDVIVYQ
jgi:CHAT domain-containing protein